MKKKFSDLPIGTIFLCAKGKFRKVKNGPDHMEGNAIGINFPRMVHIQGSMMCTILEGKK